MRDEKKMGKVRHIRFLFLKIKLFVVDISKYQNEIILRGWSKYILLLLGPI